MLRSLGLSTAMILLLQGAALPKAWAGAPPASCPETVLEGEVSYGQTYRHEIQTGWELVLDPLPSGWLLRVLPTGKPRPAHDAAELATPPYQSMTPLAISTDYSFRSQDAIGWNPRHFRYATDPAVFSQMLALYEPYMKSAPGEARRSVELKLTGLVQRSGEGQLEILDSKMIPGTADQAGLAASVASHFETTAHTIAPPVADISSLGRILWLRFRIRLTPSAAGTCGQSPASKPKQRGP